MNHVPQKKQEHDRFLSNVKHAMNSIHNFKKNNLNPKEILFFEHHLCHATPSYFLSPFNGYKAIALTIDGQGDGYFSKLYLFNGTNESQLIGQSKATLIGDGPSILKEVSMVGNDMMMDPGIGTCGKAGQGVPVGVAQPSILINKMTVGGTKI